MSYSKLRSAIQRAGTEAERLAEGQDKLRGAEKINRAECIEIASMWLRRAANKEVENTGATNDQ